MTDGLVFSWVAFVNLLAAVLAGGAIGALITFFVARCYYGRSSRDTRAMLRRVAHSIEQLFASLLPTGPKVSFGRDQQGEIDFDLPVSVVVEPGAATLTIKGHAPTVSVFDREPGGIGPLEDV